MSNRERLKVVVITGPTASGKTGVSIELAKRLDAEIVSADSMQVYRGLDIGTAKPTLEERGGVPHHLIDVADIDEPYHAGRFCTEALEALRDIRNRGKTALVVGGTALYLKVLLSGLADAPGRNDEIRQELNHRWDEGEAGILFEELCAADPASALRLHPNDRTRVLRALEVWLSTGERQSDLHARHGFIGGEVDALILGTHAERPALFSRIDERVGKMLDAGWIDEVKGVLDRGYSPELAPLKAIGYREICRYLAEGGDLAALKHEVSQATRRFAKRQMTWFRKMEITWLNPTDVCNAEERARIFLHSTPHAIR